MSVTPIDHKGRYGEGVREYWEGKVMEPQDALEGSPLAGGQVRGGGQTRGTRRSKGDTRIIIFPPPEKLQSFYLFIYNLRNRTLRRAPPTRATMVKPAKQHRVKPVQKTIGETRLARRFRALTSMGPFSPGHSDLPTQS